MLNKIALSNAILAGLLTLVLFNLEDWNPVLPGTVTLYGITLSIDVVLIAGAIAFLFRILRIHDKVSDLVRLRERFDLHEILFPMAAGLPNVVVPISDYETIVQKRDSLMRQVFYRYATGTRESAAIDFHYVETALDRWLWFWILLEGGLLVGAFSFICMSRGYTSWALAGILMLFTATLLLHLLYRECGSAARAEIAEILRDETRANEIIQVFGAL